ncbi:MAG: hypothetical protein M1838_004266 [Thelocarpon superellum]|nr:MAG: hypothetical protein M1838_004266 [Thelocarpon superellum]
MTLFRSIGHADEHELSHLPPSQQAATSQDHQDGPILSQTDFLGYISSTRHAISQLSTDITRIGLLHQRVLDNGGPNASTSPELEHLATQIRTRTTHIRDDITSLFADTQRTARQAAPALRPVKEQQCQTIRRAFEDQLQAYREEERSYRGRCRDQIARQYRIVNPNANEREVREAAEADWGNGGVFQTALKSNRTQDAKGTLHLVRARHDDIQHIEAALQEISQLFADMARLVETQEPVVIQVEEGAEQTTKNVEGATGELKTAVGHARHRRKLQWYACGVFTTIVILVAIALGVYFYIVHEQAVAATAAASAAAHKVAGAG